MEKNDLFSELAGFQKGKLKPTQTVVRHAVSVTPPAPGGRYAIGPDEDITEYYDEPAVLHKKVKELAAMIRAAKHVVAYTGAGVSTSTSLPDYRGPNGVWTLAAQGLKPHFTKGLEEIHPTICHMSLVQLEKQGLLKYVVSTNVDGLHLRSGISRDKLAELHGNAYLERCRKCKAEYLRDHDVCRPGHGHDHVTGNKCTQPGCDGDLMDSIINFGENLPEKELGNAVRESKAADLSIVMGTSMRVRPACELPTYGKKNGGKMVIVNLQKTPYDPEAAMLVRCTTDDFMTLLLQELNVEHLVSTPTGMVYQLRTVEQIEQSHVQKIAEIKKSREQPKKHVAEQPQQQQPAPSQPLPVPVSKIAGRAIFLVDQQSGQNTTLEGYSIKDLLYIKQCNNAVFEISNKCTKLIVERCDNIVLNIKGGILTSTLEMIECSNITLNVSVPIFTMQLDSSSNVSVVFSNEKLLKNLVWNRTDQLYIEVKDEHGGLKYSIDTGVDIINAQFPTMDLTSVQFITHFVDGQLESEMVIREGAGYATTAREKKIADDRLEKNLNIMQEFLNKLIKLSVHDKGHSEEKKDEKEVVIVKGDASAKRGLRILCFGDSLTWGFIGPWGFEQYPYANKLAELLKNDFPEHQPIEIVVKSVSGETTTRMAARLEEELQKDAAYDVVILLGGTNDIGDKNPEKVIANLKTMQETAAKYKIDFFIGTLPPAKADSVDWVLKVRTQINEGIKTLVPENRLNDFSNELPMHNLSEEKVWSDGLHLSAAGYDLMAEIIYKKLKVALQ